MIMISPDMEAIPDFLTDQPRWVGWRNIIRAGKPTKMPLTANNKAAASTNPNTWAPFETIADAIRRQPRLFHGCGIVLGNLDSGEHLCGADLDSCLDDKGALAEWAKPFVECLDSTYKETSPSGSGLKAFFRAAAVDAAAARTAFAFADDAWGCKRTIAGMNGADHGPGVEVYIGPGRYFTVTGKPWPGSNGDVALLDRQALLRIAELLPKTTDGARNNDRSAIAFRKGAALRRQGKTFEEMCEALRTDPETAEWCREKGDAGNGRELRRIWKKTEQHAIVVQAGLRHEAADAGLAAMVAAGVEFYQRDRTLVRVCAVCAKASDGNAVTSPGIVNVTLPMLARALGQSAQWARMNAEGQTLRIDPPREVVEQVGGMFGEWPFESLSGVIGTQTMRPDGSVLCAEGYDAATGLYLLAPPPMPNIPDRPTKQEALEALALLNALLKEFPFASNASLSVGISMLMTPVLRGALPPAVPIHAVTAPEPGTGKSYLGDIASAISSGERCAVQSVAPNPDETEKRLIGAALAGLPIIALDNCNGVLQGDFLAQVSERPALRVRPLGGSGLMRIPNTFTVVVNGNNLTIAADLTRRSLRCMMDAEMEDPASRTFSSLDFSNAGGASGLRI